MVVIGQLSRHAGAGLLIGKNHTASASTGKLARQGSFLLSIDHPSEGDGRLSVLAPRNMVVANGRLVRLDASGT
jgi:hypothetical protein